MSRSRPDRNKFLRLQDLSILYDFKFDPVKAFLHHSQVMILAQELELAEKIKKWDSKNRLSTEFPDGFDIYQKEVMETGEFRNLHNRSMFLMVYSMFEHELFNLCRISGSIEGASLTPKDLSGRNYIGQCRKYILKVLEVNLDNLKNEWEVITKLQLIRNSLAHNNGILRELDKANADFINKTEGLTINSSTHEIIIESNEFLITFINTLVDFLNKIIQVIINQKEKACT